jgi:hypothetical protein
MKPTESGRSALLRVKTFSHNHDDALAEVAFTLSELLVVVAVLALVAATRLPALCRTNTPVKQIQCLSNCRQISQAALFYQNDNNDTYPYGTRVGYGWQMTDPTGWPMQLLRYMGGYQNVQPKVYLCPNETNIAMDWVFQLHYQANRCLITDTDGFIPPVRGAQVRNPGKYWMMTEKEPCDFANVRPSVLALGLMLWNKPPGSPAYRRHSGGGVAAAADGRAEWLRMPPYQPGRPVPDNFLELGDCANGQNPDSTWPDNGSQVKLFTRYSTNGF